MSISIEEIYTRHLLSKRSYNICLSNDLLDVDAILDYYKQHGHFMSLRNAGRKTDYELSEVCRLYSQKLIAIRKTLNQNTHQSIEEKFDFLRHEDIRRYLSVRMLVEAKKIDQRCYNVLMALWEKNDHNLKQLIEHLDTIGFDFTRLKNIGLKSAVTLHSFFNYLIYIGKSMKANSPEERAYFIFIEQIKNLLDTVSDPTLAWLQTRQSAYINHTFPFSEFIYLLLQNNDLADQRTTTLFKHGTQYTSHPRMTHEQLGKKFNITGERVRQIIVNRQFRDSIWHKIVEILRLLTPQKTLMEVNIPNKKQLINFKNIPENSRFTSYFYCQLFAKYYPEKYLPVIFEESIHPKYLVQRHLAEGIDWEDLIANLRVRTRKRNTKTYQIDLKEFLYQFTDNEKFTNKNHTKRINLSEQLIKEELNLTVEANGKLTIQRNTMKLIYEYIIDILEEADEPLHIAQISRKLRVLKPKLTTSLDSLRSTMHERSIFIILEWSCYGLKKWEDEGRYLGGTIRDLVVDYLRMSDIPKHIQEITDFIKQHRNTNKHSIYTNLQNDDHKRFIFFGGRFVGLAEKKYPTGDTQFRHMPVATMRLLKRDYFKNGKSIETFDELIAKFARNNDVSPTQVKFFLLEKIKSDRFFIMDNYLYIK